MKKILLSSILLFSLAACKKSWLEIVPLGQLVATTTDDYDKLMNDPGYYFYNYTGGWHEPMIMGDEVAAEATFFSNRSAVKDGLFEWKDSIYVMPDQQAYTLYVHNVQLYNWNKIINEVLQAQGGTEAQKRSIQAEAKATRAWSYFNMVNYYCKPYTAATAKTDLGFPIITAADITGSGFQRGTLQQTYDFIIEDLKDALGTIQAKPLIVTRMSRPAVEGLLGKVYVFMGDYNAALPLLNDAIMHVTANGQTSFYNYNETFATNGSFMPIDYNYGPQSPGQNMNDIREAVVSKVYNAGPYVPLSPSGLVLTPEAQALYGASDFRLRFYTNRNPDNANNAGGRLRKYGMQYARYGVQLADLYLLRAECKARLNDLAGAQADLLELRKNRMPLADAPVPSAIANNQNALIRFVIEERIREFAMEGYRWFDMRRLSVDPLFAGKTYTHTLYNTNGTTVTYTLKPNRFTLMLPRNITDANPGMPNNL
ncbi:SusD-like starch-binding protein associating with outer membrane [Chitinophaga skermanii]|uniref:SusD-like starch-binding protein associating with outer membrane n=1 Tax=Chitinophaga skermanii TaxID=331697 RepID=A0A327QW97_9BACT|nr:RagB/SusD family nutrient uptake outer membrane protein [Chitinophaga skermanii]RAJ08879.1 SusD-like starch-binding protein associating with outer membrane [Chitinophaga skermanii]